MAEDQKPSEGAKPAPNANSNPQPASAGVDVDELRKQIATLSSKLDEVKDEAIQRRKENKALKEQLAQAAGLPIEGVNVAEKVAEAVAATRAEMQGKLNALVVRRAVERAAGMAGAHDPEDIARLITLEGIDVDGESGTVKNEDKLTALVESMRDRKPHLFKPVAEEPPKGSQKQQQRPSPTPGRPSAGGNGTAYDQWQAALRRGDLSAAKAIYDDNRLAISAVVDTIKPS